MPNPDVDKCFNALMDAADGLETVAGKVAEAACQLHKLFDWDTQIPAEPETATEAPVAVEPEPTAPVVAEPAPVTLEQVRAVLADKSRDGHTAHIRELLAAHGAAKLSAIDPAQYPVLAAALNGDVGAV